MNFAILNAVTAFADAGRFNPGEWSGIGAVFLMRFALFGALLIAGMGMMLTLILAGFIAALVAVGIFSSAVVIGLLRRRMSAGVNAFHYLSITVVSWAAAVGFCLMFRSYFWVEFSTMELCVLGSIAGISGGLMFAFVLKVVARFLLRHFFPPNTH